MKKKLLITILCLGLFTATATTYAESINKPEQIVEPRSIEMTYYTDHGTTASGKQTREGICAFAKEYIGMTAVVYENNDGQVGKFIGIYEIMDTGYGRETKIIKKNGKKRGTIEAAMCVDIFFNNDADGKAFIKEHGNKVFIQVLNAEG